MPHFWANTAYLRRTFPERPLILILNDDDLILKAQKLGNKVFRYVPGLEINEIFDNLSKSFDHEFRKGFWRYSLERLFAFTQFHENNPGPLLHLESDVLITADFPFEKFTMIENISWQSLNHEADVASLLYSPSGSKSIEFSLDLIKELRDKPLHTDMTVLAALRKNRPNTYFILPSGANPKRDVFNLYSTEDIRRVTRLAEHFAGYFDPAALGMWNFGHDPRNHFGFSKRHVLMPESIIDPSKLAVSVTKPLQFRDQFGESVFSLHLHSKDVKLFSINQFRYLKKYLKSGSLSSTQYIFYPSMFLLLVRDYASRGKMHELIANLPLIRKLKQFKFLWKILKFIVRH
jgi:hypothetical protein